MFHALNSCETCGAELNDKRAKYCLLHRTSRNRARDLARAEKRIGADGVLDVIRAQEKEARSLENVSYNELVMAIYLRLTDDPVRAMEMAGIPKDSVRSPAELAKLARKNHPDLHEGKQTARVQLINTLLDAAAARALMTVDKLSPAQAGSMVKSLAQTLEALTGGTTPVYGEIKVVIPK